MSYKKVSDDWMREFEASRKARLRESRCKCGQSRPAKYLGVLACLNCKKPIEPPRTA